MAADRFFGWAQLLGSSGGIDRGETAKDRRRSRRIGRKGTSAVTAWSVVPEDRAFIDAPPDAFPRGTRFIPLSHRGALHRLRRLRGVELPVALFDTASPLVAGNGGADMVRASSLACSGDFPLRLAICQSKHLIAKGG